MGTGGKQVLYNALMATLNPGDEVIIPAPYWVSYPGHGAAGGGHAGLRGGGAEAGFKITARAAGGGDHAADQVVDLQLAVEPDGRGLHAAASSRALTEVLMRHPQVWVMPDDMYEHLVFDDFRFATPAAGGARALRADADGERVSQGLCDDGLADRLCGGAACR